MPLCDLFDAVEVAEQRLGSDRVAEVLKEHGATVETLDRIPGAVIPAVIAALRRARAVARLQVLGADHKNELRRQRRAQQKLAKLERAARLDRIFANSVRRVENSNKRRPAPGHQ